MAEFQNTVDVLGDDVVARMIVDRTIEEFCDDTITSIRDRCFQGCTKLTKVNVPSATILGDSSFSYCSALISVSAPSLVKMNYPIFYGNSLLTTVDYGIISYLKVNHANCNKLNTLILRSNTVCALDATRRLDTTCFQEGKAGGTVYVPQALIESYQNATNWSTLYAAGTCNFVAIEGSEYE